LIDFQSGAFTFLPYNSFLGLQRYNFFASLQKNNLLKHQAGFVNIIGKPNVGKSTLMNRLVGERLSIITSKAQTTRHRIMGIVNGEDFQIVYSDTPGILDPKYKLQESMMQFVGTALVDADIILYVTEMMSPDKEHLQTIERIKQGTTPVILSLNKIDLFTQEEVEERVLEWAEILPNAVILPTSALHGFGHDQLLKQILRLLPESPPFFPKDELTDKPMRFFMSEIIREKILRYCHKEVPYSSEVIIESYVEEENIVRIRAEIMVARETQKAILIGHLGSMLKRIGTAARKDMEVFIDKKIFLEMYVKVDPDWRDNDRRLKSYGYIN